MLECTTYFAIYKVHSTVCMEFEESDKCPSRIPSTLFVFCPQDSNHCSDEVICRCLYPRPSCHGVPGAHIQSQPNLQQRKTYHSYLKFININVISGSKKLMDKLLPQFPTETEMSPSETLGVMDSSVSAVFLQKMEILLTLMIIIFAMLCILLSILLAM